MGGTGGAGHAGHLTGGGWGQVGIGGTTMSGVGISSQH